MKIFKNNYAFISRLSVLALSATLLISSCNDDNDGPQTPPENARLKVINGISNDSQYSFSVNGAPLADTALVFRQSLAYKEVPSGQAQIVVTEKSTNQVVSTSTVNIAPNTFSSAYLVQDAALQSASVAVLSDNLAAPAANKAKIRLVNMSATAGPLDLTIAGSTTPLITNVSFTKGSDFIEIDPMPAATFTLTKTGTSTVVATSGNVSIGSGQIVTLWAQNPQKLALGAIVNK